MKLKSILFLILSGLFVMAGFTSCDDDEDMPWNNGATVGLPKYRAFLLTEGNMGHNDSHLFFIDPEQDTINVHDIYTAQNKLALGDTGNDMITYNGDIYVVMNVSKVLRHLNGAGLAVDSFSHFKYLGEPRYIAENKGKLYVSCYGGYVARFDAKTLQIEDSVKVDANPEELIVYNDKVYCVNSGWGYGNTISVIDVQKFDKAESIVTLQNPTGIQEANGHIYVFSSGTYDEYWNYVDKPCCAVFDPSTKKTTKIGDATRMLAIGDNLYFVNSTTQDWTNYTTTFSQYSAKTNKTESWSLKNLPSEIASANVYMMARNPYDGSIYIATSDFVHNSPIYHFDSNFQYLNKKIVVPATNPNSMVFLN